MEYGVGGVNDTLKLNSQLNPQSGEQAAPDPPSISETEKAGLKKAAEDYRAQEAKADKLTDDAEKRLGSMTPPKLLEMPPEPQQQHTDPIHQWGSLAMMFAAFGSLATRQPFMNAMNAMAGVMNAYNTGDYTRYQQELQKWRVASENAQKMAQFEHEQYRDQLENIRDQIELASRIRPTSTALKDRVLLTLADSGNFEAMKQLMVGRRGAIDPLQQAQKDTDAKLKQQAYDAWTKTHPDANPVQQNAARRAIEKGEDPDALHEKPLTAHEREENAAIKQDREFMAPYLKDGEPADPSVPDKDLTPQQRELRDALKTIVPSARQKQLADRYKHSMRPLFEEDGGQQTAPKAAAQPGGAQPPAGGPQQPQPAANARTPAGPAPVPVPPAFRDKPDGTRVEKDGVHYIKQGNQLVPVAPTGAAPPAQQPPPAQQQWPEPPPNTVTGP